MRRLFVAYCFTVFIAGIQLFIFSDRTADYFSWTIAPPVTAAFLGASYWGSLPMLILASRARSWQTSRISFFGVFVFSCLTLWATFHHRERFHFGDDELSAFLSAWVWLTVYLIVPVFSLFALMVQWRTRGSSEYSEVGRMPVWLVALLMLQGVVLVGYGSALFWKPIDYREHWPWLLSPLTARAVAAWLIGMGIHALQAAYERQHVRVRPLMAAYIGFTVTQAVLLARFGGDFDWDGTQARVYVVFLASVLVAGVAGLMSGRRA